VARILADKTGRGRVGGYATRLNPARGDARLCPVCNEPMIAFELEGVEIDHCLACRGTWLDAGELEQIAELADVPAGPLSAALESATGGQRSSRRCPRCRRKLNTVAVGTDPVVEIDRCPLEHGLWFDAGELKTLITSFAGGEAGAVAEFLGNALGHALDAGAQGE
jgi:Zn-finger nucleic acid-binding protein